MDARKRALCYTTQHELTYHVCIYDTLYDAKHRIPILPDPVIAAVFYAKKSWNMMCGCSLLGILPSLAQYQYHHQVINISTFNNHEFRS